MGDIVTWLRERADHVEVLADEFAAISARALREAADDLDALSASADAAP